MGIRFNPRYSVAALALLAAIWGISSIPNLTTGRDAFMRLLANLSHIPTFAVLTFLLVRAQTRGGRVSKAAYGVAFLVSLAIAVIDEWYQSLVPGRFASRSDLLLDVAGIAGMVAILRFKDGFPRAGARTPCRREC